VKLTDAQAGQALDPVLNQIGGTTDPLVPLLARAIQALAAKLSDAQAAQALDPVLKRIGQTTDPDALQALAQAIQTLAAKLTEAQARQAIDLVLKQIGQPTDLEAFKMLAKAIQALPVKLTDAQGEVADLAKAPLAWAASPEVAADWARALVALRDRVDDPETTRILLALVAYPAAAGAATDVLLDAIRARETAAPAKEAGTNAALEWLAVKYPDVLRPPVCPGPPQDFDVSSLKCPDAEAQAPPGAAEGR